MAALIIRVLGSSPNALLHPILQDAGSCLPVPFYWPVSYTSNLIRLWQIRYAKHCSASRIINFVICFWNNSHTIFSSVFIDSKPLKPEGTWQFSMTTCLAVWPDCLDQQFVSDQQTLVWDLVHLIVSLLHVLRTHCKNCSSTWVQTRAHSRCQQTVGLNAWVSEWRT